MTQNMMTEKKEENNEKEKEAETNCCWRLSVIQDVVNPKELSDQSTGPQYKLQGWLFL